MIRIADYKKQYNGRTILEIPTLQFDQPRNWIKGNNGAGKSTLFKSMAGIIPFDGTIECDEKSVKYDPVEYRMKVNYSDPDPSFPSFITLRDLISFVCKSKKGDRSKAEKLMVDFEMKPFAKQSIGTFSSGMLKKTSLICSFIGNPVWIILDEPFSSLDHDSSMLLSSIIMQKCAEGICFCVSSHIEADMHLSFTSIYHVQNGKIEPQ